MKWVKTEVQVRFSECDPMNVVHHSNYFVWFEMGRIELARAAGISFAQLSEEIFLPVIDIRSQFKDSARYGQTVIVETALERPTKAMLDFKYRVYRKVGRQLLATGESRHAMTSSKGQLIVRIPAEVQEKIDAFLGGIV
ncbi:acyl-CoA thioesterase [Tumebacillus permanentifrigoris]|uniref:Acyl-CoA thioester hydrolase n=1 Tax=Tumebacillus permanentifrigoris TaxID=378543 RepID=A0A316DCC9_9BACL|nr:thioesterase family protein [Tumebacillus permanentifrigoris]PWK15861.1 acyl-CoA thioester hydrolase [Tumebacillus permanentifrigoris]